MDQGSQQINRTTESQEPSSAAVSHLTGGSSASSRAPAAIGSGYSGLRGRVTLLQERDPVVVVGAGHPWNGGMAWTTVLASWKSLMARGPRRRPVPLCL